MLGKANFKGCKDPGAKELGCQLSHYFSVAGVPTNADQCLEAVQSTLTGHNAHFLLGFVGYVAQQAKLCLIQSTLLPRGQYNSLSKHFFAEAGLVQHCKQEGL